MTRGAAWTAWTTALALLVTAWAAALVTPDDTDALRPFPVTAPVGEYAEGRNIAVTVTDVRRADAVNAGGWQAEGTWIVIDLEAQAVESEERALLGSATLTVGGRVYRASERPESLLLQGLDVGIPQAGVLAFELADDAAEGEAVLELALNADTRLDSVLRVPVDLDALEPLSEIELAETGWAHP